MLYAHLYHSINHIMNHENITVYDNGGKTIDRYTVVTADGAVYGMSDSPTSPQGVSLYAGQVHELKLDNNDAIGEKLDHVPEFIRAGLEARNYN